MPGQNRCRESFPEVVVKPSFPLCFREQRRRNRCRAQLHFSKQVLQVPEVRNPCTDIGPLLSRHAICYQRSLQPPRQPGVPVSFR